MHPDFCPECHGHTIQHCGGRHCTWLRCDRCELNIDPKTGKTAREPTRKGRAA